MQVADTELQVYTFTVVAPGLMDFTKYCLHLFPLRKHHSKEGSGSSRPFTAEGEMGL
jgi:hypothetical protein